MSMVIVKLLTKKRQLIHRLQKVELGPEERAEDEAVLAKIDTALELLKPAITKHKQQNDNKVALRRGREAGDRVSHPRKRRTRGDPQHALALVRWRRKVRKDG
jgi:hypothetical protein